MAGRNKEKNWYFTIGIDKESDLIHCLEKEAKEIGTRNIATVIKIWLEDYCEIVTKEHGQNDENSMRQPGD